MTGAIRRQPLPTDNRPECEQCVCLPLAQSPVEVRGPLAAVRNILIGSNACGRKLPLGLLAHTHEHLYLVGGAALVVAFARALVMEPDLLLIDEPSAGLAPNTADDVFDDVLTVNDHGTSILMVEQNAVKGLNISDRGYVLDQGTVAFENEAESLLDNPEVSQLYLGG